ncbi:FG-GAP-like repeat-containing protein [Pseudalkalibacillus berkeleyi]|uniref:FG-GAP-like repeat-containing protein n=1 Tax=Pseudalkalibacillus berkeleyi TaxID=1069813 RepID=A0ABS9H4P5_9BACL|nr:FG-GAP-like repeat-containing protein [Pseudalkalibacillus berkeleyi]MCF6138785.1 FG-GAP-like repeat-containing protein [Pseudalkalibacillus berkeleyi]
MKKTIIAFTIVILLIDVYFLMVTNSRPQVINVLIVYEEDSTNHLDTYQHYKQTLVANTKVETMPINVLDSVDLNNYEMIYLDKSIIDTPSFKNAKQPLQNFVSKGGHLFLENQFYNAFPKSFIGAKAFEPIHELPNHISYPSVNRNLTGVQNVIKQIDSELKSKSKSNGDNPLELGYGIRPSTAETIAESNGVSLFTINNHGDGTVFFASELLPNDQFITSFDFSKQNPQQEEFNYTFLTGNYLFRNEYLSFVAKDMYGYSVSKVIGTHGRPGFAMQYIVEDKNDFKENRLTTFMKQLQTEKLVPTLSLSSHVYEPNTWKEAISYYKNVQNPNEPVFENEKRLFSSGTPVKLNNKNLTIKSSPEQSGFTTTGKDLPERAYIDTYDLTNDGQPDLVAGSLDGKLYYYEGTDSNNEWNVKEKGLLKFRNNKEIDLGGYAAPIFYDYNKDGLQDIVSGNQAGEIFILIQSEDGNYENPRVLFGENKSHTFTTPEIADINEDGVDDLIYGTASGDLFYRLGTEQNGGYVEFSDEEKKVVSTSGIIKVDGLASPKIVDYNNDNQLDLLIGMKSGFIKRYEMAKSKQWVDKGYLEGTYENPFNNKRLWSGRNSVPTMADINGDNNLDLLVGHLTYGDPINISDEHFPYRTQLERFIQSYRKYASNIKPHIFMQQESGEVDYKEELKTQREIYKEYGIDWRPTGLMFHKAPINEEEDSQSHNLPPIEGVWNTVVHADDKNENNQLTIPFIQMDNKILNSKVYHEPNVGVDTPFKTYLQFDLPFTEQIRSLDDKIWLTRLSNFKKQMDYNSMSEQQLYKSVLATQQSTSTLNYNPIEKVFSDFQNLLRRKLHHTVYIENNENDELDPELIGPYNQSLGYKVELGEKYKGFIFNTDAPIYMNNGSTLYFSGKEKIQLKLATEYRDQPHIMRSNIPLEVDEYNENITLKLLDSGMQQIKVYAPSGITLTDEEWEVEKRGHSYILTRYGDVTTLNFSYK